MTAQERMNAEGRTILRVARELRGFLQPQAAGDPEAQSLLDDIATLEDVGRWLAGVVPIDVTHGIPSAGSAAKPSIGTAAPLARPPQEDEK